MPRLPASVTEPTHEYKSIHLELPIVHYKRNKYDTKAWMTLVQENVDRFVDELNEVIETAHYVSIGDSDGCNSQCDNYCYQDHKSHESITVYVQYTRPATDEEIAQRTEIYQKSLEDKKNRRKQLAEDKKAALKKSVKANKAQVLKILEELNEE